MYQIHIPHDDATRCGSGFFGPGQPAARFLAGRVQVRNAEHRIIFDTQSTLSGASNPPSDETPAADDQRTEGTSETPRNEETIRSQRDGGETADESTPWRDMTVDQRLDALDESAPTSSPTTPANGQPTKSGPTTTPCADCLSRCGLDITTLTHLVVRMSQAFAELDGATTILAKALLASPSYSGLTTAAQPTPSEGPTRT